MPTLSDDLRAPCRRLRRFLPQKRLRYVQPSAQTPPVPLPPTIAPDYLEQTQSPLFSTLPGELRMMIYRFALGGINHHLHRSKRGLRRLEFATPALNALYWPSPNAQNVDCYNPQLLALLLTCRKIYAEASSLLYTTSSFSLHSPSIIFDLSRTIPPHRFHTIVSLELFQIFYYAQQPTAWNVIATMKSLRVLRVFVYEWRIDTIRGQIPTPRVVPRIAEQLHALEPLKAVKGLDIFDVSWPWKDMEGESPLELGADVPFRLVRMDESWERLGRLFFNRMPHHMWP
ncbi:hypothetical protein MMC30_006204 [Trapelia coarctata]|nr:hypothetical protein [Trapelia coarctata]